MSLESNIKNIRTIYQAISGKTSDIDVSIIYRGTSYGISKPWVARIDVRIVEHTSCEESVSELLELLKKELLEKIKATEAESNRLRAAFKLLGN